MEEKTITIQLSDNQIEEIGKNTRISMPKTSRFYNYYLFVPTSKIKKELKGFSVQF